MPEKENRRIETESEVRAYLQNLRYALNNGAKISFQEKRDVDNERDERCTNRYTAAVMFPEGTPKDWLREELKTLTVKEYMGTVKDTRFPERSEMREFGKIYKQGNIYIKIRVKLLDQFGNHTVFVMSYHFAEHDFTDEDFPYGKK